MLLAKAMKETGSADTGKVAEYLAKIKTYDGESGSLISDGKRGFTKELAVKKVIGGSPQDLHP